MLSDDDLLPEDFTVECHRNNLMPSEQAHRQTWYSKVGRSMVQYGTDMCHVKIQATIRSQGSNIKGLVVVKYVVLLSLLYDHQNDGDIIPSVCIGLSQV